MARGYREPGGKIVYPATSYYLAISYFPTDSIYPAIPTTLRFHSTLLIPTPQGRKATYIWTQIPPQLPAFCSQDRESFLPTNFLLGKIGS